MAFTATIQSNNTLVNGTTAEYQHRYDVVLLDGSIPVTATGAIAASVLELGHHSQLFLELTIPVAPTGTTPAAVFTIETASQAAPTVWRTLGAFASQNAQVTTPIRLSMPGADWWIRVNTTTETGTTPSFSPVIQGQVF
jgi:hypothetical protein